MYCYALYVHVVVDFIVDNLIEIIVLYSVMYVHVVVDL